MWSKLIEEISLPQALESLHEWGVDNLWLQRVPAVHDSDFEGEHFLIYFLTQAGTSKLFELL